MPTHYTKYDTDYESSPEQKKRRAKRNHDRRAAARDGKVSKGDGKDVHHPDKSLKGGTKVLPKSRNRSIK